MDAHIYQIPDDEMDVVLPSEGQEPPIGDETSSGGVPQSHQYSEVVESSDTFTAPMRRHRVPRIIPTDAATELRNKDLIDWGKNYLMNMKTAAQQKIHNRSLTQAKKNAEHYVWGSGLGGIGQRIYGSQGYNPFDMFIGDKLFETITGVSHKVTGLKHDRDSGIDETTQEEARRVRQKIDEPETARGADDEGFSLPLGDDVAIEMPREAVSALDDQQILSAMPWNMSASIRGSSAIPRSGRIGIFGSADQRRHGSRLVSPSPLHGRGQSIPFDLKHLTSDTHYGGDEFGLPGLSSDGPEPAALPDTTTSRLHEALSTEGENFIAYIAERINDKHRHAQTGLEIVPDNDTITFEELLPPAENTKVIACHGLMMALTLGTKGMFDIQQSDHLGDIHLRLSEKVRALHAIVISDAEEGSDSSEEEVEDETEEERSMESRRVAGEQEQLDEEMEDLVSVEGEDGHFQE
jgi:meiotic recombination protein REC8